MRASRVHSPLLKLSLLILIAAGDADDVSSALAEAKALIDERALFNEAVELLEQTLARPDLEPTQRIEAYRLLGISYVAKGEEARAENAFAELVKLSPSYVLDSRLSPKIREVFDRAKRRTVVPPQFSTVSAVFDGGSVLVRAEILDPQARVDRVDLFSRATNGPFSVTAMRSKNDGLEAALAADGASRVEYYLEAKGADGSVLARHADAGTPRSVSAFVEIPPATALQEPAEAPSAWYEQWWVWTAVGVVAAGTATAIILASSSDPAVPEGTVDPIRLD